MEALEKSCIIVCWFDTIVIILMHIYCQSSVKRAHNHLPTVPSVNLSTQRKDLQTEDVPLSSELSEGLLLTSLFFYDSAGDSSRSSSSTALCKACGWQVGEQV